MVSAGGRRSRGQGRCALTHLHSNYRSPDDAKIKQKMIYASSKDAIRKALVGISSEIQGTDVSEVDYQTGECGGCMSS